MTSESLPKLITCDEEEPKFAISNESPASQPHSQHTIMQSSYMWVINTASVYNSGQSGVVYKGLKKEMPSVYDFNVELRQAQEMYCRL